MDPQSASHLRVHHLAAGGHADSVDRLFDALTEHLDHCGFGSTERTQRGACPTYSIAVWGDGAVSYIAITRSGFFNLKDDYSSVELPDATRHIDHSPEKWVTISQGGRRKTVHDFYGAPDVLIRLEQAIESLTDSYRYTQLDRPSGIPDMRRPEIVLRPGMFVELPDTALGAPLEFQNDIYSTTCFPLYLVTGGSTTAEGRSTNGHVLLWINRAHTARTVVGPLVSRCDVQADGRASSHAPAGASA